MNLELSQISEVPQALEILRAEVDRAETAIRQEGAKAMTAKTAGSLKAAEEAIAYAKRLRAEIYLIDHVPVGDVFAHKVQGNSIRLTLCDGFEFLVNAAFKILQGLRQVASASEPWSLDFIRNRKYYLPVFIYLVLITHSYISRFCLRFCAFIPKPYIF